MMFPEFHEWNRALDQVRALAQELFERAIAPGAMCPGTNPPLDPGRWIRSVVDHPKTFEEVLEDVREKLTLDIAGSWSPSRLGHITSGTTPWAALAELVVSLSNRYAAIYHASPGGVTIHNDLIRWLGDELGLGGDAWGTFVSGGSLATLTALVTARETRPSADWHRGVVYLTSETHMCVRRALRTAGLASVATRMVPVDDMRRMIPSELVSQLEQDRGRGLEPWIVVATAGTVHTGAVDPLAELADIASRERLWLHVDAAYGGNFILTEQGRALLAGIGEADSVVVDPHKGMFVPYGLGVVLVKRKQELFHAFSSEADYLQMTEQDRQLSPMFYSPEQTRPERAVRLWFTVQLLGRQAMAEALQAKLDLARRLYDGLVVDDSIELAHAPQTSVVAFRVESDDITRRVVELAISRGSTYLSFTTLDGRLFARACVIHPRASSENIDHVIRVILNAVKQSVKE